MRKIVVMTFLLICLAQIVTASEDFDNLMIVDQSGAGQFTSITAALAALPDMAYQRVVILFEMVFTRKKFD